MSFSVKSAENAIMSLVKTSLQAGAKRFLNKLPSATITAISIEPYYLVRAKIKDSLENDEEYKKLSGDEKRMEYQDKKLRKDPFSFSVSLISAVIGDIINPPHMVKIDIAEAILDICYKTAEKLKERDKKRIQYIMLRLPDLLINLPEISSEYLLKKTMKQEQENNQINNRGFLLFTVNFFWKMLLIDCLFFPVDWLFSLIAKIRPISRFLNKLPWWMKKTLSNHLGEKVFTYVKIFINKKDLTRKIS
jgi:hypothetical protein